MVVIQAPSICRVLPSIHQATGTYEAASWLCMATHRMARTMLGSLANASFTLMACLWLMPCGC